MKCFSVKTVTDREILASFEFNKVPLTFNNYSHHSYYLSNICDGSFLVVEKCDDAVEVYPIVNGQMYPVSWGYWLENYYATHFKQEGQYMIIRPTHILNTRNPFIVKRIRGNQTMTMHFGHFLLDELNFIRCFLSFPESLDYSFIGDYNKKWQTSLLSYFFPTKLQRIISSDRTLKSLQQDAVMENEPSGIIRSVILVNAPYRIIRLTLSHWPGVQIGKVTDDICAPIRKSIANISPTCINNKSIALLERRVDYKYPKRWMNAFETVSQCSNDLDFHFTSFYPEDYDPVALFMKLSTYRHIVSEPGSALFLFLMLRQSGQNFYMPHVLKRIHNRHWPSMLLDFKSFGPSLVTMTGTPLPGEGNEWHSRFTLTPEELKSVII